MTPIQFRERPKPRTITIDVTVNGGFEVEMGDWDFAYGPGQMDTMFDDIGEYLTDPTIPVARFQAAVKISRQHEAKCD